MRNTKLPAADRAEALVAEILPPNTLFRIGGSFAYGRNPREARDLDVVVLDKPELRQFLTAGGELVQHWVAMQLQYTNAHSYKGIIRAPGHLYWGLEINLILLPPKELEAWIFGIEMMSMINPQYRAKSRERRVALYSAIVDSYLEAVS